jgi:hypothetical protein
MENRSRNGSADPAERIKDRRREFEVSRIRQKLSQY